MKKSAIAAVMALTLPVMANAAESALDGAQFALTDVKNSVKVSSYGICYGMKAKFSGTIKTTTPGFSNLGARLTFVGDSVSQNFTWDQDFLLNNVDPASGEPNPVDSVLTGTIATRKNDSFELTFTAPDQLKMATALPAYAADFPEFLSNASLTSNKPNSTFTSVKPVVPYSLKVTVSGGGSGASVTEVSNVQSNQGGCSSFGTITRKYKGLRI